MSAPATSAGTPGTSVAIIGAGFGGLAAAIELIKAGHRNVEIFEKAASVGGVWRDNTYPGAACDVPSSIYSFSYELKPDWSARFGTRTEIHDYLTHCADKYGITPRIRFNSEVTALRFDQNAWVLSIADQSDTERFDAVIAATGLLSRPKIPTFDGLAAFRGTHFHSAQWNHHVDLTGKRVAVVGSGASAIQLVPEIADTVGHLTVIQRSPNWVLGRRNYRHPAWLRRILTLPAVARLQHNVEFAWYESRAPLIYRRLDPARAILETWMRLKIRREIDDLQLRAAVTPRYRAMCNRLLMSNRWYPTLNRDDVDLKTAAVADVTGTGLLLDDGTTIAVDIIIWCTGFTADQYLAPIAITGLGGRQLHDHWADTPNAYRGVTVAGFPNLFLIYGPGTASNVNTVIFMLEQEATYARKMIDHIATTGTPITVSEHAYAAYNADRERAVEATVYGAGCPGWLSTKEGHAFAVWPGSHRAFAKLLHTPVLEDYETARRFGQQQAGEISANR